MAGISSAGVSISYSVEATTGVRPLTLAVFTKVAEVKTIPEIASIPATADATTLDNLISTSAIDTLVDVGGAVEVLALLNDSVLTAWETAITAYTTGQISALDTWWCVQIPGMTDSFYFIAKPVVAGLNTVEVQSVLFQKLALIITEDITGWKAKPTPTA